MVRFSLGPVVMRPVPVLYLEPSNPPVCGLRHRRHPPVYRDAVPHIRDAGARDRAAPALYLSPHRPRLHACRALRKKSRRVFCARIRVFLPVNRPLALRFSRWRSPKSMSKRLTTRTQLRRLTRRGDSLLTLLHSPPSALCAHMGAGISRLQSMRAPLRRPWPKLGLARLARWQLI